MPLRLGKLPASPAPSDFRVGSFLDVERVNALPPKPYKPHDKGYAILMYGNGPDDPVRPGFGGAGCCVFAMMSNAIQLSRHAAGLSPARLNGATAIAAYSEVTGYVIGDDSTDQGTDMGVAASWWRKTGMRDLDGKRHKIGAWATFTATSVAERTAVVETFGCAGYGIQFPDYAMSEFDAGKGWTYHAGGAIDGGHAILVPRLQRVNTWAEERDVSDAFLHHLADEAFAYISPEFLDGSHETPEGLDVAALTKALAGLT